MSPGATPVRDAATTLVVRDDPDLHVFMLRRNPELVFGGGAHVFPGGAVDDADRSERAARGVRGLDDRRASSQLGLARGGLGFWVAAVREVFEEGGILLTRDASGSHPDPQDHARLRDHLNTGSADAADLFARTASQLDASDLVLFAHHLTPPGPPRRFDTWFFLALAPPGQVGAHDADETVASEWCRPAELLERCEAGDIELFGPTPRIVSLLADFDRASDLLAAARDAQTASAGRPGVRSDGLGERIVLAGEPDYATTRRTWAQPLVMPPLHTLRAMRDASEGHAAEGHASEGVA